MLHAFSHLQFKLVVQILHRSAEGDSPFQRMIPFTHLFLKWYRMKHHLEGAISLHSSEGSSDALLLGSQSWTIKSSLYMCGTCFQNGNQVECFSPKKLLCGDCIDNLESRQISHICLLFQIWQKLNDFNDPC